MDSDGCQKNGMTPIQALTGIKLNRDVICVGLTVWILLISVANSGLESSLVRPTNKIMIDYLGGAYRVYILETFRILIPQNVRMIEDLPEYKERSVVEPEEPVYTLNVSGGGFVIPGYVQEKDRIQRDQFHSLTDVPYI